MSSNAKVSKTLVINSPQELHHILKSKNYVSEDLQIFIDNMDLFIDGCACDSLENWERSVEEYSKISQYNLDDLKKVVGCTSMRFYLDKNLLFEI